MESTGNYWITTYDLLEAAGIGSPMDLPPLVPDAAASEVFLVNARHVKGVPGKKTDVCDAQWLQPFRQAQDIRQAQSLRGPELAEGQLHAAGLLKKSFRPAQEIVPLRYLMRHRRGGGVRDKRRPAKRASEGLVGESSRQIQHMQKAEGPELVEGVLTELNLKIQHVFSDIDGVSAQAMISAIPFDFAQGLRLEGERDPVKLARLRDRRCRSSEADIIEALKGSYREEYLFVLRQCQSAWQQLQGAIADCDTQITRLAAKVKTPTDTALPPGPEPAEGPPASPSPFGFAQGTRSAVGAKTASRVPSSSRRGSSTEWI